MIRPATTHGAPQTTHGLLVHGTTVALDGVAALLRGPSGAGKSDLALRFLAGQGCWPSVSGVRRLVADDQTCLAVANGQVTASAPAALLGKLEVRGVGIVEVPTAPSAHVILIVDLVGRQAVDRLPDDNATVDLLGCRIRRRMLDPFEASAATKLTFLLTEMSQ